MRQKDLRLLYIAMFVVVIACVVTYAGKDRPKKPCLPVDVKEALDDIYPRAKIKEVEVEKAGPEVYEIELEQYGRDVEVTFAEDGTLMEVETEIAPEDLPCLAAMGVKEVAEGAAIEKVDKELHYAVIKLVRFAMPKTTYEVELSRGSAKRKIEVAPDGTILKQSEWKKCDEDEAGAKCDERDDED